MTKPDDSTLTVEQLLTVQRQADLLLRQASAYGRFPTPVDELMDAAKLVVVEDQELDEQLLRRFMRKAKAGLATLKSALSKVLGLFEPHERLVVIDKNIPPPRIPFVKLHEAGHGFLPHQSGLYRLIHDCEKTLDPEITDLFEREANVFASEVLFQGNGFANEAHESDFSLKVPLRLAKQYGASNYSTFRRYVSSSPRACCLVALDPLIFDLDGGFHATVRRVVVSKSFDHSFDGRKLFASIDDNHAIASAIPKGKRMTFPRQILLTNRNGNAHRCTAEAFDTSHQILVLICDAGAMAKSIFVIRGQ